MLAEIAEEMKAFAHANPIDKHFLVDALSTLDPAKLIKFRRDFEWTKEDGLPTRKYQLRIQLTVTLDGPYSCLTFSVSDRNEQVIPEPDIENFKALFLGEGQIYEHKSILKPGKTRIFFKVTEK